MRKSCEHNKDEHPFFSGENHHEVGEVLTRVIQSVESYVELLRSVIADGMNVTGNSAISVTNYSEAAVQLDGNFDWIED